MPQALIAFAAWAGSAIEGAIAGTGLITSLAAASAVAYVAEAAVLVAEVAALGEISSLLTPKVGGNFGTQVDWKADPQAGLPYAVGRTGVAGNIVFKQSAGTKSSYLNTVTVFTCAGPIDSYESFAVNATATAFGTDSGEGATGFYQNKMWRLSQLGAAPEAGYLHPTATGTKDTPADHSGQPAEWTSTHKLSGYAADLWILDFDAGRYAAGVPQRLTVGKWVKAYDPRLDSTYPGGAGTQRSNDETTWTWSENPYIHALTWLIGRKQNGKRIIGVGIPIAAIDVAAYVAGANVADANGWKCGGLVYSTDDKYEVLKAFLQAGGGKPMRLGAKVSCLVNTPRTSLATLVGSDVVGDVQVAGGVTRRGRINTIWPKYREETQAWEMVTPDDPVAASAYFTADGGPRSRAVEYPLVQNVNQVAQLARYDIEDSRELTPISLPCKPIWMGYRPGDCITVNEPELGLNGQTVLILKRTRDPATMQVTLTCRSETAGKHAFALGQTGVAPTTAALTAFNPNNFPAPGAGIYTASGSTLTGAAGLTAPALTVTATTNAPDTPYATALLIRYRVHGATPWTYWPSTSITVDHVDITGVVQGTQYDVQVAYKSVRGTESPWTDLTAGGPVTAGVFTASNRTFDNSRPASPLEGDFNIIRDGNGRVTGAEIYKSGVWVTSSSNNKVTVGTSAPVTPTLLDVWYDTTVSGKPVTKYWNGTAWVAGSIPAAVVTYLDANGNIVSIAPMPGSSPYGMGVTLSAYPFTSDDLHIFVSAFTIKNYGTTDVSVSSATITVPTADTVYGVVVTAAGTGIGFIDPALINTFLMDLTTKWVYLGAVRTEISGGGGYSPSKTVSGTAVNTGMGTKFAADYLVNEP